MHVFITFCSYIYIYIYIYTTICSWSSIILSINTSLYLSNIRSTHISTDMFVTLNNDNNNDRAMLVMKSGKWQLTDGMELPNKDKIKTLAENETYKYLGILEADTIKQAEMKEKIPKEYLRRTRKLHETKLNCRNLIKGINTWAVPLIKYSGPFLKWTRDELKQMDQRTRKLMTTHKALHPRDDVDRLYVSRKEGGRGLASIEDIVDASIQRLKDYIQKHEGGLITATRNDTENTMNKRMTIARKQKWEGKQLYGQFKRLINNISHDKTWTWLRKGNFKRETESLLIAVQDSALRTNHTKARIDKTQQNSKCRLCGDINHIISECNKLAQREYKARHDWAGKVIDWEMCKKFKFDHTNKWYMHNPAPVLENDTHKLLWDFKIQTDHLIRARRPDLIIINKKKKENMQNSRLSCPGWPQNKTERMWKEG